ncbi:MAG TPA: aldo/keto reductase [Tepidisphaeraceae bacterium]|nr:aldo/keto reductase [Tepidisphaeraceae bacterium]
MSPTSENSRRQILKMTAAAAGALAAAQLGIAQTTETPAAAIPTPETTWNGGMPYRKLGKTGEVVSLLGLGGFHIASVPTLDESMRLVRSAIDRGITFMDNCWDYHNGKSEVWMGQALRDGYRAKVFLMTKVDGHTKTLAAKQIDESLKRLQTDHIDLLQHHEVVRPDDPEKIFADGGSHEAVLEAQKAGKIRYIGFTGHKDPAYHLHMLEMCEKNNYPLTSVQMPLNVLDAHFKSFQKQVLPVLVKKQIAPLAMKTFAAGGIIRNKIATPVECLHYAMSLPVAVTISGMDSMKVLEQNLAAAQSFKPMSPEAVAELLGRTRAMAEGGKYEQFKMTRGFDGTDRHPEWVS